MPDGKTFPYDDFSDLQIPENILERPSMRVVLDALEAKGLRNNVKVMVGGAPVNEKYAKDIDSDGYAPDAGEAVDLAKKLMRNRT